MSAERRPPRVLRSRLSFAKCTSTPMSISSPRSAQSLRFLAPRSILWMTTPRACPDEGADHLPKRSACPFSPQFPALRMTGLSGRLFFWAYRRIASCCSLRDTPCSPCPCCRDSYVGETLLLHLACCVFVLGNRPFPNTRVKGRRQNFDASLVPGV